MSLCIALHGGIFVKSIVRNYCLKWVIISELTGIISGLLSMRGMEIYNATVIKAPLTPPGWVFVVAESLGVNFPCKVGSLLRGESQAGESPLSGCC